MHLFQSAGSNLLDVHFSLAFKPQDKDGYVQVPKGTRNLSAEPSALCYNTKYFQVRFLIDTPCVFSSHGWHCGYVGTEIVRLSTETFMLFRELFTIKESCITNQ